MDEPPIFARHLLVCRDVVYDPTDQEAPYTAQGVLGAIGPDPEFGYPHIAEMLWLFTQVFGDPGRYTVSIELGRLDDDGEDAGPMATVRSRTPVRVRAGEFVEGVRFRLVHVVFPEPGLYEFRLMLDGFEAPLAAERIYLKEV